MKILNTILAAGAVSLTTLATGAVAQSYPDRDLTFVVPYNPGGSTDPIGRAFSAELSKILDRNVVVENRPGGSATIGTGDVVKSDPDGYMIGLGSNSSLAYQPLDKDNLAYSSPDDYEILVKLVDLPAVLYVSADAPWQTLEEFMNEVKAKPGEVRVSVSGLRTAPDLVVQYINANNEDIDIRTVPFSGGGGEALTAVLSGRVEASVGYGPSIRSYVDAGKIRALGVFNDKVYEAFPEATPVSELGYKQYLPASYYVIAPNGMPDDVKQKLIEASAQAVQAEDFVKFAETNSYQLDPKTPEEAEQELREYSEIFAQILAFIGV